MQLVLSGSRVVAHGENFLAMGDVVINTETGAKYENATIAECNGCPSDIDKVGYEYHGGVFTPCAPYGTGDNNGFFMEVCETCATPRSSGIPIKGGLKKENLDLNDVTALWTELLWENASPDSDFESQDVYVTFDENGELVGYVPTLLETEYIGFVIVLTDGQRAILSNCVGSTVTFKDIDNNAINRTVTIDGSCIEFGTAGKGEVRYNEYLKPLKIYGVKL